MKQHIDLFIYISQQFFSSFLFPLLDSGTVQYFVCQKRKIFYPHSLPMGSSVPVNQPQDRADNGKDATKFPSLKITAYEFFIGTSLKIPTGWDAPVQHSSLFDFVQHV